MSLTAKCMKDDLLELSNKYKKLSMQEFELAAKANTTADYSLHLNAFNVYHQLSETYRLMSMKSAEYINQFPGV